MISNATVLAPRTRSTKVRGFAVEYSPRANVILTLLAAWSSARLSLAGRDITRLSTERRVRLGIGYVPQEQAVFARSSARKNLLVGVLQNSDRFAIDITETLPDRRVDPQ